MRPLSTLLAAGLCLIAVAACGPVKPPVGRWEGTFETHGTMIVARLEINKTGAVFVSAPDALDITASDDAQREVIRQRLAMDLAEAWARVQPRKLSFDGKVFRLPGHIAPQAEWDGDTKTMTLVIYPGKHPTIRIKMHAVGQFSADPWPAFSAS
jgi:hypothetical protein